MTEGALFLFFWLLIGAVVGAHIGKARGRELLGAGLGLILGPIGWLAVAFSEPPKSHSCPHCGGLTRPPYVVCPLCGRDRDIVYYVCPTCGISVPHRHTPCRNCGNPISWEE